MVLVTVCDFVSFHFVFSLSTMQAGLQTEVCMCYARLGIASDVRQFRTCRMWQTTRLMRQVSDCCGACEGVHWEWVHCGWRQDEGIWANSVNVCSFRLWFRSAALHWLLALRLRWSITSTSRSSWTSTPWPLRLLTFEWGGDAPDLR